ncbi:MAG TPA: hypothetical protein VFU21_07555, partial [Kofleriaceae bacterium]|nr:hypothetical protein [Kofleriaceae bacterium]
GSASADPAPLCPPAARIAGDAELGHAVVLELSILGVASRDIPPRCPAVDVVVARSGDAVAVSLRDGAGRQAAEVVTDASVAAAWIESWLHPEIRDPLLAVRSTAAAAPEAAASVSASRPPAARAGRFAYRGLVLGAAGEMTSASDGSDWRALSASLCARFGAWCAGLSARGADNRGMSADGGVTAVNRWELSLSATMSASLSLGRMSLVPSAGVGLAYSETGRGAGSDCLDNVNPDGTTCEAPYAIDDDFSAYSVGPRAELGVAGAFPIAGPLSLTLGVAMTFAPMARGEPVTPDYAAEYFDKLDGGGDPSDPDLPPDDRMELYFAEESYQLPAEPSRFTRLSLGLAWEIE